MSAVGHSLPIHSAPVPTNVRYYPHNDQILRRSECSDVPLADIGACRRDLPISNEMSK
jgi:hypothetical protein